MLRGMATRPALRLLALAAILGTAPLGCGSDEAPAELIVNLTPDRDDLEGREELRGTVMFSAPVPAGRVAYLQLKRSRPVSLQDADARSSGRASLSAMKMTFAVRRIASDNYSIFAWVDLDGDGRLGTGDLAGYYAGATTAPVQEPAAAQTVFVQDRVTADFGIGPL